MIDVFIVALSAIMFRLRGSGMKRFVWVAFMLALCYYPQNWFAFALLVWVHMVLGVFPTQSLFTAIHGEPFGRRDKWPFHYPQDAIVYDPEDGRSAGVAYGFVRGLLALPTILLLSAFNLWILLLAIPILGHGYIYYLTKRVDYSEYIIGFTLGLMVVAV